MSSIQTKVINRYNNAPLKLGGIESDGSDKVVEITQGKVLISGDLEVGGLIHTGLGTPEAYKLGQPGELGFGVATAPNDMIVKAGCVGLPGHNIIGSDNYGNYLHIESGAILCYIPKHYYSIEGNDFLYSDEPIPGYVIDRSFINGGVEIDGIFVSKYGATNNGGILSSQFMKRPLSSSGDNNGVNGIAGAGSNTLGAFFAACKTMDKNAVMTPLWVYTMLARMAKAHGQVSTNTSICAYIDVDPKMPKGNLNNSLADYNDTSVTFTAAGYLYCALVGSGKPFAKTTHNGQNCGIADLCGNMWEAASGFIRTDANGFMILKESTDIRNILNSGTGTNGAFNVSLYDTIVISDVVGSQGSYIFYGNGSNQVFAFNTDRNSSEYKRTSIGIPISTGVSAIGTIEFGNDGLYRNTINNNIPLKGGYWGASSLAGGFALGLDSALAASHVHHGSRASVIV